MSIKTGLLIITFLLGLVVLAAIGYALDVPGVRDFLGQVHSGFDQLMQTVFILVLVLLGCGALVGSAYVYVDLKKRRKVTIIGPGRHGYKQAVIHNGQLVQLAQPGAAQMDPMQQLAMLKTVMAMQGQIAKYAQSPVVQEVAPLEIEGPAQEQIGAVVRFEDVEDDVPDDMSLLGIHPATGELELSDWLKLKMLWIIGSSSTGKSNTVYGMALQAYNHDAKLSVVDQHAVKKDSLARKLEPLKDAYLHPVAVTDSQVLDALQAFKTEFERRVHCPVCARSSETCARCSQPIVLIMDELNRMNRNEALLPAIKEIVAIGGEESRGFGMYVWAISQKAVHLKWLRDSAITIMAHKLTSLAEAKLACNDDLKAARRLTKFKIGRLFVSGVDFEDFIELQQPLYSNVVEATIEAREPEDTEEDIFPNQQWEANREAPGSAQSDISDESDITDLRTIKKMREIGKQLKAGKSKAEIVKSFGLPYGRATQEIGAVVDMIADQIEAEG